VTAPVVEHTSRAADSRLLVERFQRGDLDAYAQLYGQYHDTIYRYLRSRLQSQQTAEDLTHDTFLRAFSRIDQWEWQGKDVGAWLVTIARNLLADHCKGAHNRLSVSVADVSDFTANRPGVSREGNPEAATLDHMRDSALLTALWRLTEDQRACLVHRFVQGLSVAETAAAMSRDEGAIKALQFRGVTALANRFEGRAWR
jgi:RNA polymerase sigma-70 factor (ECF subfamily)